MRIAVAVLLTFGLASPAAAQCGSSSDGDGDDGDSCPVDWSYGDDDDDSGARPAPRCREVSLTLGRSQCRRYGEGWDAGAAFRFTLLGIDFRRIRIGHMSFSGSTSHDEQSHAIGSAGRDLDDADLLAGGVHMRLDLTVFDYLSLGIEAGIVGADVDGPSRTDGPVTHSPSYVVQPTVGLVVGAAIPIDIITIRPEVLLGGRFVVLNSQTQLGDCISRGSSVQAEGVVEPRLAVEVFLSRYIGVSGYVGANLMSLGEVHGGLAFTLHTRAYDGQPR